MKRCKWIARLLVATLTVNTATGYIPPAQIVQAGQNMPETNGSVNSAARAASKTAHSLWRVTLEPSGGSVSPEEIPAQIGQPYGTLPTPIREGYNFLGWHTSESGGTRVDETTPAGSETILHARWEPLSVRVDLYPVGGNLDTNEIQVTFGQPYGELPTPTKAGFQFSGWYTAYDGGEKVESSDLVNITSAIPLYAHWEGKDVTISFQAEGTDTEIPARTAEYGKAYGSLPEITRDGYLFAGWFDSPQGGRKITETTPVLTSQAHTLYAQWSEIEISVTLDTDGAECETDEITVYPGFPLGTLPTPRKTGYLFRGWYAKDGEKETPVTELTKYTPTLGSIFYAKWEGIRFNITLYPLLDDGMEENIEVTYGEPYPALPELEKTNYNFLGWFTKINSGEKIETGSLVKLKTDISLYAHWEGKEYTVTFDPCGGTVSNNNIKVIYGSLYGTLPTPTKKGYNFNGWYLSDQKTSKRITKNDAVSLTADATLYAHWTPKRPEITFYANGGSMYFNGVQSSTCSAPYYYDQPYGQLPLPKRKGYTFIGWFTEREEGDQIFPSTNMTSSYDDSLYAHWRGNPYTVTLDAQGGVLGQKEYGVTFGERYGDLPTPTKENYTFTGWKLGEENGGTSITSSSSIKVPQDHTLYATYKGIAIKLTYDNNGGSEGSTSYKTTYYGEPAGTLRTPTRSGYLFLGWFANGEQITKDTIITLTGDTTIRAEWKKKGYTVTFDANGGECSTTQRIYEYGDLYDPLPVPVWTGCTFTGWYTSPTAGTQIKDGDTVKLSADDTLYARWKGNAYTVTLDLNGGTATSQSKTVTFGSSYGTLPTPKRTGFTFAGWFTAKQYGYKITSTSKVETPQNHILYALWKQETFTITFEANGGTVAYRYIGIPVGTSYSAFPTPVKTGYIFDGWYTSSTSGTKITYLTETDTLYAHWKPDNYRINFDSCGGTSCAPITVAYAKTYGTLPTPTKPGLSFAGWYTEPEGGTKIGSGTYMKKAYEHTLYAHWKGIISKLSYDANGGSSVTTTKSITSGQAYGTLATASWTGHKFMGWYTAKDGGTLITSESIVTVTQDQKLYAHWEALRPTIRFAANGGDIPTADGKVGTLEVLYTYGQKYTSFPTVARVGYLFKGWFTSQTTGTQITEGMVCEVTTSDTFYAHWEGVKNTVRFDANEGSLEASPITVVYGETYGTLPTPTRPGHTFSGWFTERDAGEKITSSSEVEILSEQVLYAQWELKTYKVTLDGNGGTSVIYSSDGKPASVTTRTITTTFGGTYGGSAGSFPTFSRTGYEFLGFFTGETDGEKITAQSNFPYETNQTIYAHWKPKNIVVTFYEAGGSPVAQVKRVPYKETYKALPEPTKAGFVFNGWRTSETGTTAVTAETIMNKTDGHTLYASWTPKEYVITFDSAGGEPATSTKTIACGQSIGTLPKPVKTGYQLSGWYTKQAGGVAIKTTTKLNTPGERRYYAHWEETGINVRFLAERVTLLSKNLLNGDCYGLLLAAEKEGHDFTGWFTRSTGGDEITPTDRCYSEDDLTFYAQFKPKTPTLILYANGGNLTQSSKVVTYNKTVGELPIPTLANYEFAGWYTAPEGGSRITQDSIVPFQDTTTLYARWKPSSLSVTFDACGGNVTSDSKKLTYEKPYGELPVPTREGFIFTGWFTQPEGGQQISESSIVRSQISHTLYAHWEKVRMLLIFDAGEGNCAIPSKALAEGESYGELPEASRTGYSFTGWFTQPEGGEPVSKDTLFEGEKDITIHAHWEAKHYTITFNAMGGTCTEQQREVVFGQPYGELPEAEYEGFHFIDWYLDIEGQNLITANSNVETAGDHTLYAYYLKEEKDKNDPMRSFHLGEPGANPITGNVSFTATDMVISIPGLTYEITRTYNSQNDGESILGRGWSFGFDSRCEIYSDGVIVYFPDGSSDIFWRDEDDYYTSKYSRRTAEWTSLDPFIFTVTEPTQEKYHFNLDGKLTHIEDRYGNRTAVTYTDQKISSLTDAAGRTYTLETNKDGKLIKLSDPMGNEVRYTYNEKGYLASVSNVLGGTTNYTYDEEGYIEEITNPDGYVVQRFAYSGDKKTEENTQEPLKENLGTPSEINLKSAKDTEISSRKFVWDNPGETQSVEENLPKTSNIQVTTCIDAYGGTKTYAYDPDKKQTVVTSADGREWVYYYNSDMYLTAVKNPDGSMEKTEYATQEEDCHYADITSTTNEYGSKTSYTVDGKGNITAITHADKTTKKMWYDEWNNCVIECSENNIYTYHLYDDKGIYLLKNVRRTDGAAIEGATEKNLTEKLKDITCADMDYIVEEYIYYTDKEAEEKFHTKLHGLLARTINPEGETQDYAYDAYGNATAVTDAAGNTYTYTYDLLGHRLSETTARGDKYSWEYLPNGFVTREHYPDGGTAVSLYDKSGHLLQTVQPDQYEPDKDVNNTYTGTTGTFYLYSANGRLLHQIGALGDETYYTYDTNGNIIKEARSGAETISYAYDNRDRLLRQWYHETAGGPPLTFEAYEYESLENGEHKVTAERYTDLNDKITQVTIYDNMDRPKEAYLLNNGEKTAIREYTYYPDGALHTMTENGYTTTYQYDAQGNLTVCEEPYQEQDGTVRYIRTENEYDRAGRLVKAKTGEAGQDNMAVTLYRYENGRLTEETSPSGIRTSYTYDADDNIIREQTGEGSAAENTALITQATHDFRGNPLTQTVWVREEDLAEPDLVTSIAWTLGLSMPYMGQDFLKTQEAGTQIGKSYRKTQTETDGLIALTTTWEYDLAGRLLKETAPDGVTTLHTYDAAGNETSTEVRNVDGTLATSTIVMYNKYGQAVQVTDALGAVTKYTYDHRDNLLQTEDALGGISLYTYNFYDQITAEVSPANYRAGKKLKEMGRTEYTYDAVGRLKTQIDYEFDESKTNSTDWPKGLRARTTRTYTYDSAGNTAQICDAEGRGPAYTYYPGGLVATSKSAAEQNKTDGVALNYSYDVFGNTVGIRAGDYEHRYNYDPEGRLLSESDCYGTIKTCTYDTLGRLLTETDAAGAVTYYEYNALGEISYQKLPGDETVPELEIFYKYNRAGKLSERYDSTGNRITYLYDSLGNLLAQTAYDTTTAETITVSYTYDANSNCTSATDAAGNRTEYTYDALGRKIAETFHPAEGTATPKTTQWEYDADGHNTLLRDYLGNETRTEYDSLGRVKTQYDALGNQTVSYRYDDCDRQVSSMDALGYETTYTYDADGNVISTTAPNGAVTGNTYDYAGSLTSKTDPKGNRTIYTYDGRGRLTAVTNALGETHTYTYDNADRQTAQTDPAGRGILYTYNVRGDLATRSYIGEATRETYIYTANGKPKEKISRDGTATTYSYDGFGRLVLEQAGEDRKTYTYDKVGNCLTETDHGTATTRTYDGEGRVTSKTVEGIGTTTYTYDLNPYNGEVSERATAPDGTVTLTWYDRAGRIQSVESGNGIYVSETYNKNGSRASTSYSDGSYQEYGYDPAGYMINLTRGGNHFEETETYTYDKNGNLASETSHLGTTLYTYDALDRLLSVTEPGGKITEYTYDASGNRATKTERHGGAVTRTTYIYDTANLLLAQECDDGSGILYTYDANGNLILEESTAGENLIPAHSETVTGDAIDIDYQVLPYHTGNPADLSSGSSAVTVTGGAVTGGEADFPATRTDTVSGSAIHSYTYDGFNRLTSYQSGDTIAAYTYDAQDYRTGKRVQSPAGEEITRYFYEGDRVVLEADASGTITAHNTYSINLASRRAGEEGYYYLYNAHGDVVTLVGMQDHREVRYRYDAFGTLLEVTGDADNSITYAGYQYDSESGLYYLNARYYDSTTARFLTEDTYTGQANDPLSLHRYTYCANNPLRYTDPDGHFWGAALRFLGGAALGAAVELGKQIFIEKRDHIDVKAVIYEMGVGGVSAAIGGVGGAVTKLTTPKEIINGTLKTAGKEALGGFVEDVCFQMFVEGKSVTEIDWGQSLTTSSISGLAGATSFLASQGRMHLDPPSKIKVSEAAALIDNVADVPSHPKANILPEASTKPNRGAVKNAAGGLADAGSAGNAGRKSKTAVSGSKIKSSSVNKSSPILTKNQNKIQRQTVGNVLSEGSTPKHISDVPSKNSYTISKLEWQEKRGTLTGKLDKLTADERKMIEDLLSSGKTLQIIPKSNVDHVKTPDFLINGVKTELKTLNGSSHNTPIKRIQEGFKQHASTVIIDARKTNLSIDDLVEVISRARGIYNGQLPGEVQFWTNESIYTWTK